MLLLALALAAAPPADTLRARAEPAAALQPVVVVHRQPALPIVALRLSLLADDPPGYAGAGHLFQHLLLPSLQDQVRRVGGRVSVVRTADAVVYTVVGPATELDYLAGVLRSALQAPLAGTTELLIAQRQVAAERSSEREVAPSFVRAALRSGIFPDQLPASGTDAAARRLETAHLDEVWAMMYRPERVMLVAAGDVETSAVLRAFQTLSPAAVVSTAPKDTAADTVPADSVDADGATADSTSADTVAADSVDADSAAARPGSAAAAPALGDSIRAYGGIAPEATRGWVGAAWSADSVDAAAMSVAARIIRDGLRRRMPDAQVDAEHWWTHDGQAIALVMAGPGPELPVLRQAATDALDTLAVDVNADAVRRAADAVRREMLFYSRTPDKMVDLLGDFADRTGDRAAAQTFFDALGRVSESDVRSLIEVLKLAVPARVEVPPQRLRTTP
jgi:predicted Zn-dependent peptidase